METIEILQISFYLSFLGMIFILARNLPLVAEHKVKYVPKEKRLSFRLKKGFSEGRIKTIHKSHKIQEKIGHRLRISVLKIDNFLSKWLKDVKEKRFHIENIYFKRPKEKLSERIKKKKILRAKTKSARKEKKRG